MSATITFAPLRASSSTVARPIPEPPPVTTATFPSISMHPSFRRQSAPATAL
jgi:hypothetical protein